MRPAPSIGSRLRRRFILVTDDALLAAALRAAAPAGWEIAVASDPDAFDALGGFEEILQHRFVLLDLEAAAFDPVALVTHVRRDLMLNVPVVCLGGPPALRDRARLARADRFFERDEAVARMRQFCEQYGWGAPD